MTYISKQDHTARRFLYFYIVHFLFLSPGPIPCKTRQNDVRLTVQKSVYIFPGKVLLWVAGLPGRGKKREIFSEESFIFDLIFCGYGWY